MLLKIVAIRNWIINTSSIIIYLYVKLINFTISWLDVCICDCLFQRKQVCEDERKIERIQKKVKINDEGVDNCVF